MPPAENAWIQNERARRQAAREQALVEGYESNLNQPPPFTWDRPWSMLTAAQRAYLLGRELQAWDREDAG